MATSRAPGGLNSSGRRLLLLKFLFSFELTRDAAVVRSVFGVAFSTLEADRGPGIYEHFASANDCVLVRRAGKLVGLAMVCTLNDVLAEFHFSILPAAWGAGSQAIGRAWLAWFWQQSTFERLIAGIDSENRLALRYAKKIGFDVWGVNERAMRKRGRLKTLVMVGLNRPLDGVTL